MNIIQKLTTAFRGGIRETAEVVIDANSLRIFAQEIHECEGNISQSKQQLASIIAEKMRVKREVTQAEQLIHKYEKSIASYLESDNEGEALLLAQTTSEKEASRDRQQQHYQQLVAHENMLKQTLKTMVNKLDYYRSEYRMAEATGKLQSAQSKLSKHENNTVSRFGSMQESLSRIQSQQQLFSDEVDAMERVDNYLSGNVDKATESVVNSAAQDVLNRVKNRVAA